VKYFGKKSLSSFLSGFFHVSWYVVLVISIIAAVIGGAIILYSILGGDPAASEIAKGNCPFFSMDHKDKDWETFKNLPLVVKIVILPYFGAVVLLLLRMIKKAGHLFTNFKNDILFDKSNVLIISTISKLNIWLSILTFSFGSLLISLFLFMLCEIFKSGASLQEEHDLTV
jgi:hypothetical protein